MGNFIKKEELEKIQGISILDYAENCGLELVKVGSKNIRVKGWKGLNISVDGSWFKDFASGDKGGIIQFVQWLDHSDFLEAAHKLKEYGNINESTPYQPRNVAAALIKKEEPKEPFISPKKNETYRHMYAYLLKTRKLDSEIVQRFVKEKKIYENDKKSCVFIGFDDEGKPANAAIRSSNDFVKFQGVQENSDGKYGFVLGGTGTKLRVFEAPIDMLSYLSLRKRANANYLEETQDHFISLMGLKDVALEHYLKGHPEITTITFSVDNDEMGDKFANKMRTKLKEETSNKYDFFKAVSKKKDWNQDLKDVVEKDEQMQKKENEREDGFELR